MTATRFPLLLGGLGLALGAAAVIAARRRPVGLLVGAWRVDDGRLVIPALQLAPNPATRRSSEKKETARIGERPTSMARLSDQLERQSREMLRYELRRLAASLLCDQDVEHTGDNVVR